jgi:hypothetical protein
MSSPVAISKPRTKLAATHACHPQGVGTWILTLRDDPAIRARSNGHTAFDAYLAARKLFLPNQYSFAEFDFRLVSDEPSNGVGLLGGRA